jgi:hypothetical protein
MTFYCPGLAFSYELKEYKFYGHRIFFLDNFNHAIMILLNWRYAILTHMSVTVVAPTCQ